MPTNPLTDDGAAVQPEEAPNSGAAVRDHPKAKTPAPIGVPRQRESQWWRAFSIDSRGSVKSDLQSHQGGGGGGGGVGGSSDSAKPICTPLRAVLIGVAVVTVAALATVLPMLLAGEASSSSPPPPTATPTVAPTVVPPPKLTTLASALVLANATAKLTKEEEALLETSVLATLDDLPSDVEPRSVMIWSFDSYNETYVARISFLADDGAGASRAQATSCTVVVRARALGGRWLVARAGGRVLRHAPLQAPPVIPRSPALRHPFRGLGSGI